MSGSDEQQPPEAPYTGPEAPAWVADLLASLPGDDPPIPDDVASRVDATLAMLAAGAPPGRVTAAAGTAPDGGDVPAGTSPAADPATVVPITAAGGGRHRSAGAGPWAHRLLLGGVAAVAVVVLGGLSIVAVQRSTTPGPGDAGVVAADAAGGSQAPAPAAYVSSGLAYTAANLTPTTRELLAAADVARPAATGPTPGASAPGVGATGQPLPATAPEVTPPATRTGLPGAAQRPSQSCLESLTGSAAVAPVVVDEATYDGRPAFVVVVATTGDPSTVDVWVVARTCSAGAEGFLTFARVTR